MYYIYIYIYIYMYICIYIYIYIKVSDNTLDAESGHTDTPAKKMVGEADTWDFLGFKEETENIIQSVGLGTN